MPPVFRNRTARTLRTRQSLLERVKDWGDSSSWSDFFDTYSPLLYNVARRAGLSEADADDIVQETLLTVARKIGDFRYDPQKGSFKGWMLQLTRSRIVDRWRRERKHLEKSSSLNEEAAWEEQTAAGSSDGFDEIWNEQWQRDLFEAATERVRAKVKPRQYQIFHCLIVKGWTPAAAAKNLRVNLAQVYFARRKVAELVRQEVKRLEQAPIL